MKHYKNINDPSSVKCTTDQKCLTKTANNPTFQYFLFITILLNPLMGNTDDNIALLLALRAHGYDPCIFIRVFKRPFSS